MYSETPSVCVVGRVMQMQQKVIDGKVALTSLAVKVCLTQPSSHPANSALLAVINAIRGWSCVEFACATEVVCEFDTDSESQRNKSASKEDGQRAHRDARWWIGVPIAPPEVQMRHLGQARKRDCIPARNARLSNALLIPARTAPNCSPGSRR